MKRSIDKVLRDHNWQHVDVIKRAKSMLMKQLGRKDYYFMWMLVCSIPITGVQYTNRQNIKYSMVDENDLSNVKGKCKNGMLQ